MPPPFSTQPAVSPAKSLLRLLIADDELAARRRLRLQLARIADVEIIAECGDGTAALEALPRLRPDVALLDIEMPGLNGLAVVRSLGEGARPVIIFVTAHEQHALSAFEVRAADYLLKPYTQARLEQALDWARTLCERPTAAVAIDPAPSTARAAPLTRLVVPTGTRMQVVATTEIDWIESAGNYAVIHVGSGTHILRETLLELEARLAPAQFFRISRTTIVNLDRVRELRADEADGHVMILAGGAKLVITRGIREVQKRLENG